jgi:hypothetical protein
MSWIICRFCAFHLPFWDVYHPVSSVLFPTEKTSTKSEQHSQAVADNSDEIDDVANGDGEVAEVPAEAFDDGYTMMIEELQDPLLKPIYADLPYLP